MKLASPGLRERLRIFAAYLADDAPSPLRRGTPYAVGIAQDIIELLKATEQSPDASDEYREGE